MRRACQLIIPYLLGLYSQLASGLCLRLRPLAVENGASRSKTICTHRIIIISSGIWGLAWTPERDKSG